MIKILLILLLLPSFLLAQEADSLQSKPIVEVEEHKPWKAVVWSVVPGGGQIYNEQYFKSGLFLGGFVGLGTALWYWNSKYQEEVDFIAQIAEDDENLELYRRRREFYRDYRDQMAFYLFGLYMASGIDAYAGAKLYTFDTGDDLSFHIRPNSNNLYVGISLNF